METKRILVVAADPEFTTEEFLNEEIETISGAMDRGDSNQCEYHPLRTLQRDKFFKTVGEFLPNIIHFTTRGSPNQRVLMEDAKGWVRKVTGPTLMKGLQLLDVRLDYAFFSDCTVHSRLDALESVAEYVISARVRSVGVDISEIITDIFYSSISRQYRFEDVLQSFKGAIAERLPGVNLRVDWGSSQLKKVMEDEMGIQTIGRQPSGKLGGHIAKQSAGPAPSRAYGGSRPSGPVTHQSTSYKEEKGPRSYRVWFGTNRALIDEEDHSKGFGIERGKTVSYGYCDVSVPKNHTTGSIGESWWKRWPRFKADNKLKVRARNVLKGEEYWRCLRDLYANLGSDENNLLIFIHGYNVTFDDAAIRAAQLGFDLKVRGATAFFSWPSKGSIKSYAADVASLGASEDALGSFVMEMAHRSGAENIHLIVHSMGNRGLLRAFKELASRLEKAVEKPFQQIILAAPDVDTELFEKLAGNYAKLGQRTTMYVSNKDKALRSSGIIHEAPRAGYTPPVTVVGGVDTVEVSQIDLTFLGHGYIADARELLNDMHSLIETNLSPERRFALESVAVESGLPYWAMKK